MFYRRNETESMLDAEIRSALVKLKDLENDSNEYGALLERVTKLSKLKAEEKPERISPNNALLVAANLVGILAILGHEHVGPVTSKAMAFVVKPR